MLEEVASKPAVILVVLLAANDGTVEAAECVLGVMLESSSARNDIQSLRTHPDRCAEVAELVAMLRISQEMKHLHEWPLPNPLQYLRHVQAVICPDLDDAVRVRHEQESYHAGRIVLGRIEREEKCLYVRAYPSLPRKVA